ncbi:hypothetical protein C8Q76DRAFT_793352 [Earliella scabrosa]|nr:hypothetical protein C8Q76DRAFT_793352 [Earliella scabrosa]
MSCYGTAQNPRREHGVEYTKVYFEHGVEYTKVYFEQESRWRELIASHNGRLVPFLDCCLWTQGMRLARKDTKQHPQFKSLKDVPKLPLVGKLTGYLLAVDLVYTGLVAAPSQADVALVIRRNDLGSLRGLQTTNQLPVVTGGPTYAEVEAAFARVYAHLEKAIPRVYHECIRCYHGGASIV